MTWQLSTSAAWRSTRRVADAISCQYPEYTDRNMTIRTLDNGLSLIDLDFQGSPGVIASYLVEEDGERALIETGPTSTLDALVAGLREIDVEPDTISKLLVTHIHLDHAGASGTWIRRFPGAQLFVHE